jgi:hypothetical protein
MLLSPATLKLLNAVLSADDKVTARDRANFFVLLRNGEARPVAAPSETRLVRRAEAARRLGCSLRLIDRLCHEGRLQKRRLPGRKRAHGILETDLLALLAGS